MDMETVLSHAANVQRELEADKQRKEEEKQIALLEKLNTNINKFVDSVKAFFDLWSLDELARLIKSGIVQSTSSVALKLDLANSANAWAAKAHLVMPEVTIKDILDASKTILAIRRDNELKNENYPDTKIFWYKSLSLREFAVSREEYTYSFSVDDTMDMRHPIVSVYKNDL